MAKHLCKASEAGILDNFIRRWMHKPDQILKGFVHKGMKVLDLGCGSGYFTVEMARLVGPSGKVVAADIQEEMLKMAKERLEGESLGSRVKLHKCNKNIGLKEKFDFIFVFYVLHEVESARAYLHELKGLLRKSGKILLVEPKFHVTKREFLEEVELARKAGFKISEGPRVMISRAVVLEHR
ncbi:TPA: class I SAM-dependent methyltransferase [Candidatus Woesearchaeota archaeon]|nr:class I SAM-dependent methyltransferase [Candidatus Woesearchaeota archaeon]